MASALRWALRIFGALVLLGVAAFVAAALLLPSLLSGDAAATRIREAALEATGSRVEWEALDVTLFPPALRLEGATARAEELGSEPWLAAREVELRLAWLPLLARTVLVDSLSVEGARLALRRETEGWVIPGAASRGAAAAPAADEARDAEPEGGAAAVPDADGSFQLALRRVALRDGALVVDDRSLPVPQRIELGALRADLEATAPDAPVEVSLEGTLGSGGGLAVEGHVAPDADLDLVLRFDALPMELLQPYLEQTLALAGRATGEAALRGTAGRLDRVGLSLRSDDAALASDELSASGPLTLELEVDDLERPTGRFALDATRAVLVYQVLFRKPAGVEASAGGRFRTRDDGSLDVDFDTVRIRDAAARGELRGGPAPSVAVRVDTPLALDDWAALVPALEGLGGRLALPELALAWPAAGGAPSLAGRAELDGVRVALGGDPARTLVLRGGLEAVGAGLTSRDLVAELGGQALPLSLRVEDLFGAPRWWVEGVLADADANVVASAWAQTRDAIYGTLGLETALSAPVGGETPLLDALEGLVTLQIAPGRLRGVSLLRTATESIGPLAETALLAGQLFGGSTLQRFYEDEFSSLAGSFAIRGGRAHTRDLRLVYRLYQIDLRGDLGLADGSLDLDGDLTLFELDESGETPVRSVRRVFPLAGIRGTVSRPRVAVAPEAALAWVAALRDDGRGDAAPDGPGDDIRERQSELEREIDERLGEGSGREIFDALEGLLGSGRRK